MGCKTMRRRHPSKGTSMTKDEALKLALEAIEELRYSSSTFKSDKLSAEAIIAIKEALALPARTGWPDGLLQDDDRKLSKWLASKPGAKHVVDMAQPALCKYGNKVQGCTSSPMNCQCCFDSLDDLDEEPAQEPVAWMFQHEETGRTMCVDTQQLEWGFEKGNPRLKKIAPLYTTPPQRPWVGLTEEEVTDTENECEVGWNKVFAKAIEFKLKEKNT